MKRSTEIFIALLVISLLTASLAVLLHRDEPEVQAQLVATADDAAGFARAEGLRPLGFPTDHGPHPDYQTEWWYYTGNLETGGGRHFGYQLTFFRRALVPPEQRQDRP